jgi:hypothetical protein
VGQPILNAGRDLGEYLALGRSVRFELTQSLGEDHLTHPVDVVAEGGEAVRLAVGELAEDLCARAKYSWPDREN